MPSSFLIRPFRPQDETPLAVLLLACRRRAFHWCDPGAFTQGDFLLETAGERIWVAELEDGSLAGFVSIWEPEDFIHHLYVSPSYQRQGVGRTLLETVMSFKETNWRLKCPLVNVSGLAFYDRLGWRVDGTGGEPGHEYYVLHSPPAHRQS